MTDGPSPRLQLIATATRRGIPFEVTARQLGISRQRVQQLFARYEAKFGPVVERTPANRKRHKLVASPGIKRYSSQCPNCGKTCGRHIGPGLIAAESAARPRGLS